ncbi:MAG TPA: aldo/keto reductase [Thermoleophilaceae bacterium]|nr:aldo/keto reductase [Thermoleophilaceae bacterium]
MSDARAAGTFNLGDMEVCRMGYGAMRITGPGIWGPPEDHDEAIRVLKRCIELGVNLIDTADSYGPEVSENLIAEALYPYPEDLVIATKGGLRRTGPGDWPRDLRPERIKECCEASLRRLKLDRIDLYQLHAVDPNVPYEETVGAAAELKAEGKIRHVGVSNVGRTELEIARGIVEVVSVQNRYSVVERSSEKVLKVCEEDGLGFFPWWPLGAGDLGEDAAATLDEVARAHDASRFQIAIAWLLAHSPVTLPIPGTSKVAHLEENVAAASIKLSDEDKAKLDTL